MALGTGGLTLSLASSVLKNYYLPPLREQLNNETPFFKDLRVIEDNITGKNTTVPIHTGRNTGISAFSDGGALPTAGKQGYQEAVVPMRYMVGSMRLTDQTIEAMKNDRGAFFRAVDSEMKGLVKDLRKDMMRQIFGYGDGRMAIVSSVNSATSTITVPVTADDPGVKFFNVGDVIESRSDSDYSLQQTDFTVVSADAATGNIVVSGTTPLSATTTASAIITKKGAFSSVAATAPCIELMGLATVLGAGNRLSETTGLQGLTVAAAPVWKGYTKNQAAALDEDSMQLVVDQLEVNGADLSKLRIYCSHAVRREYTALLEDMRRYVDVKPTSDLAGGQKAVMFGDIPVIVDIHMHRQDEMFFVDMDSIGLFRQKDFSWLDRDGQILKWDPGYAAFVAYMTWYGELGTVRRNSSGKITNITL